VYNGKVVFLFDYVVSGKEKALKRMRVKKALVLGLASLMLFVNCLGSTAAYAASTDGEGEEKVMVEEAEKNVSEKEAPSEEKTEAPEEPAKPEVTVETVLPEVEPEVKAPEEKKEEPATQEPAEPEAPKAGETKTAAPRLLGAPSGEEAEKKAPEWLLPENFERGEGVSKITADGSLALKGSLQ